MLNPFDLKSSKPWLTRRQETIVAFLFFLLLTAIFMRPVLFHFFTQINSPGDTYEYVWRLWWFKHTLIDTAQSPWLVPFVYYPHGYLLAYSEVTPTNTLFGLPFTIAFGEYSAHNALLFIDVFLAGFNTFLLTWYLTGSWWAGLLAGVLFGFAPYRRGQYLHLNQMAVQWFPLIFLFLEKYLRTARRRYAVAGGIVFGLNGLASWYFALAAGLLSLVWLAGRTWPWPAYFKQRHLWAGGAIFAVTAAILILPFLPPYLTAASDPLTQPPLENVNFWSASPTDYLIPNPFHPLWGRWIEENLVPLAVMADHESPSQADFEAGRFFANSNQNISTEFLVSSGLIGLLFALYGLRWTPFKLTRPWLLLVVVSVILSFGPTLHLAGRQVFIPTSPALAERFNQVMNYISTHLSLQSEPFTLGQNTGIPIPLPALLLRWFVPAIGGVRTWARFGQFAIFGIAILAAYGATTWYAQEISQPHRRPSEKSQNQKPETKDRGRETPPPLRLPTSTPHPLFPLPWLLVIGLALFEVWWTPMPTHVPFTERPVDVWLRRQPDHGAIIQFPLDSSFNGAQFIYTRAHGKPIAHGYGSFFGFMFGRRNPELLTFPDAASLALLSRWGVRYVLIETEGPGTDTTPALLQKVTSMPCLHSATVQGSIQVFELVGCNLTD